jgi:heat shock protein HslJ
MSRDFRLPFVAVSLLILAIPACAKPEPSGGGADPSALTGTVWRLTDASMASLVSQIWPGSKVTIEFRDGQATGTSACNQYGGSYTANADGSITFGEFHSTLMACVPAIGALEQAYMAALGKVTTFAVDGTLKLTGSGKALTYDTAPPVESLPLVGTKWNLASIVSGDTVSSVPSGVEATLLLKADGTASGSGGCNVFGGSFESSDTALTFGPLAGTQKHCGDAVMSVEQPYLAALQQAATYSIAGNTLTIADASGNAILEFTTPVG